MALVLTRRAGEKIFIGKDIELVVLEVRGARVRLGVSAPADVVIRRDEVPPLDATRLNTQTQAKRSGSAAKHQQADDEDRRPDPDQQV